MICDLKSVCPLCSVGCGLVGSSDGQTLRKLKADSAHPSTHGQTCPRARALLTHASPRARYALLREGPGESLMAVSPSRAIAHAANRLTQVLQSHGPQAIAFYAAASVSTETLYLTAKFAKAFLRTNHMDCDSHSGAGTSAAFHFALNSDGAPACFADIEDADTFLLLGVSPALTHPVLADRVRRQIRKRGARCILAGPGHMASAEGATLQLSLLPGTEAHFLTGILRLLADWGRLDREFIESQTNGWLDLRAFLADAHPDRIADRCGIALADLAAAARLVGASGELLSFLPSTAPRSAAATLLNLHLALGQIARPGAGPLVLHDHPNALGATDAGALSHLLPGQRLIARDDHRHRMEQLWGLRPRTIQPHPGYDGPAIFAALARGEIRALYLIGPHTPDSLPPGALEAMARADVVIMHSSQESPALWERAHIVFPAASTLEQTGTFCNSERRVALMDRTALPPGDAQPDWLWLRNVAMSMGFTTGLSYESAAAIYDELSRTTAARPDDQSALSHTLLRARGPQPWPYPALGQPHERRTLDDLLPTASSILQFDPEPIFMPDLARAALPPAPDLPRFIARSA